MAACASIMTSATPINIYSAQAPVPIKQETHNGRLLWIVTDDLLLVTTR